MATLYKQSKSPYWFADYYLSNGKRRRISTKKADRADAEFVLAGLITAQNGKSSKRQRGKALSSRKGTPPPKTDFIHDDPDEPHEKRPLTLRQLAGAAGVCLSTVSNALRNDRHVAQKTRERVQALAAKLGYKANPMVSALMASRARLRKSSEQQIIAYINSYKTRDGWRYYASLVDYFEGARARAIKCGYQLEEFWLREPRMSAGKLSDILFSRGIHGVLLGPLEQQMGHLSLKWERFSVATLGYTMTRPTVHRAVPDQLGGIRLAIRHLRKLGYRRIGLVLNPHWDARSNKAWTAGFGGYLLSLPPRERTRPFLFSKPDPLRFQRWLKTERPDAIICSNAVAVQWMKEAGFETPKDYGFASLNRPLNDISCSGIYQNTWAIGAAAVDLIVSQIHQNERGLPDVPKRIIIDPVWIDGPSTRPQ